MNPIARPLRLLTLLPLALALSVGSNTASVAQTASVPVAVTQAADNESHASLYHALGEKAGIRSIMDDLVQRLATDPRTASMFSETNRVQLANQLTEQSCQLTGGPCTYKGPDMKTAHEDMKINKMHFNALIEMAQQAMSTQAIPFRTQNRLLALLAPMHRDVITLR